MWINVRSMDGKKCKKIDGLSKLTTIDDLRIRLVEIFDAPVDQQRLFYRGKQLENGYTLFDYDVGLNDIVQILIRPLLPDGEEDKSNIVPGTSCGQSKSETDAAVNKENEPVGCASSEAQAQSSSSLSHSSYFKVGEIVDAKDEDNCAWFEAKLIAIQSKDDVMVKKHENESSATTTKVMQEIANKQKSQAFSENFKSLTGMNVVDQFLYKVVFDGYEDDEPQLVTLDRIRPRARKIIKFDNVNVGDVVMINYNIDNPTERGYWYDCIVTDKKNSRTAQELKGNIFVGGNGLESSTVDNCQIRFTDEIFAIEERVPLTEGKRKDDVPLDASSVPRKIKPKCEHCLDVSTKRCTHCSCHICGGKDEPGKQILCDECDLPYHIWCLNPPLKEIPDAEEWYCPLCKTDENEVVKAGEKLKESKKKSKMASANNLNSRDWGRGMACVGRTKECTLVPRNHYGPIPGVEVGMMWKFRVQVSESGVHRPHVAGIHGRESEGAYSIVLSGGYEDDVDDGEEFKYTGSGGRDLSGNKRTADQSCDQTLTRMNKALALNCAVPLDKNGGEADDWKSGKSVRVVRNCKGRKHSKYCPEEGNRYDGIYKIVKYWPEAGKSGHLVWRYLLRRDDPTPAPWTKAGKKRIQDLGFKMQYPEGYLESLDEESKGNAEKHLEPKKRSHSTEGGGTEQEITKKTKYSCYELAPDVAKLINKDKRNKKTWDECKSFLSEGNVKFLKEVESHFECTCCQEVVVKPITTDCCHNVCKPCLQRSFKADVYSCPMCRQELGKNYDPKVNTTLGDVLQKLLPGYDAGR